MAILHEPLSEPSLRTANLAFFAAYEDWSDNQGENIDSDAEKRDCEARVANFFSQLKVRHKHREEHQVIHDQDQLRLIKNVHFPVISRISDL